MTQKELEKLQDKLEVARKEFCGESPDCDPNRCSACIGGHYADECAFESVENALDELISNLVICQPLFSKTFEAKS